MSKASIFGRGISFPPRVGADGRLAWSEGEENIRESIRVILMTEQEERIMLPEFGGGLSRYLFEPNTVATRTLITDRIKKALGLWEPRIAIETIKVDEDPNDPQAAIVTIQYKLVATQSVERMDMNIRLG
ncbi:MAG: phage tail protein [Chloroflexi bacterium HGW-Chloroflexi-6]|nr:MAG: phage tail protein [Chloroflexi bacterium HGW-Chloroflexi-6]